MGFPVKALLQRYVPPMQLAETDAVNVTLPVHKFPVPEIVVVTGVIPVTTSWFIALHPPG